jgi:hypothetical protein
MYAWIDEERWMGEGQPPLTEAHSWLVRAFDGETYGKLLTAEESIVVGVALYKHRHPDQPPLDLNRLTWGA